MTNALYVGKSERTPCKHKAMDKLIGQEVGVAGVNSAIRRSVFIDLTAGDGGANDDADAPDMFDSLSWARNCSPGLLALHARSAKKPTTIVLYEIQMDTCANLIRRLTTELPRLGYAQTAPTRWILGNAVDLNVIHGSGSDIDLAPLQIGRTTSVMVLNDPNAVSMWAMRPSFAAEITALTPWFRSISTMGCNVGGLKRLLEKHPEEGARWMAQIRSLANVLLAHHDLFLAAIDGDSSQWAYLVETSKRDRWRDKLAGDFGAAFGAHGYLLRTAWLKTDAADFWRITDILFKTRKGLNL